MKDKNHRKEKKKILFIGGSVWQLPPLKYAKKNQIKVILVDFDKNAPGRKYADEFYCISITDKKEILKIAKRLLINGVVSYGSDVAAPTAAYLSEKLNLPGNPYESVKILTRKNLFRKFLKKNNFNVPNFNTFNDFKKALEWSKKIKFPLFIKPIDSSGSRGVGLVNSERDFLLKYKNAIKYSNAKRVIIEKPLTRKSYQIAGDGFLCNGKLNFFCWGNEHFEKLCNGLVPIGESFPTILKKKYINLATKETQRLIDLLNLKNGALNFDFIFDERDTLYFIEIGPRNGGCLIPEVINMSTNVDLVKYTVESALGNFPTNLLQKNTKGYWSSYMVHSIKTGIFKNIEISNFLKERIVEKNIWIKKNQKVYEYNGGDRIIGTFILNFKNLKEMLDTMDNMEKYLKINLSE